MVMEIPAAARRMAERKVKKCFTMASPRQNARTWWGALAFAEFVACEISQAVVSSVFVRFTQGGVVEDLLYEFIDS